MDVMRNVIEQLISKRSKLIFFCEDIDRFIREENYDEKKGEYNLPKDLHSFFLELTEYVSEGNLQILLTSVVLFYFILFLFNLYFYFILFF